jgi:Na+/citrate or Na+/malate symporter
MSETGSAAAVADLKVEKGFWPEGWWQLMDRRIGVIPLPLFVFTGLLIAALCVTKGNLPAEMTVMVATLGFFGFTCGEFGKRLPIVGKMGAAAICATFIPSALVHYGWLPEIVVKSTTTFYKSTNILYLYICCIIVGSVLSMDRRTLIQGFLKIFVPMFCGAAVGMVVGTLVGMLLGKSAFETFFFLVLPTMAGGVGEGAIPLSIGFSEILQQDQGAMLGRVLPIVMLGGLTSIITAGTLNQLGKKYPHLTGEGRLLPGSGEEMSAAHAGGGQVDAAGLAAAALMAVVLYMVGMLGFRLIGLPAPVGMLFAAVAVKLLQLASPQLNEGARAVYKFFSTAVTYPILFAVGVAITPWERIVEAFSVTNVIVVVSSVLSVVTTGFFVAKKIGMYPVDTAVVSCCQCGQGGTGDVAILTAANRMEIMPFAQIATRIGGAINVTLALLVLSRFFHA